MGAGSMAGPTEDDRARDTATSAGSMPVILMYHSIAPYEHDPYQATVSPARFEQQMRWLRRRGLRGASVREVLDARASGCGPGLVGLTFDDGYADFAEYALPVLERFGFSATVYVIAGRMGGDNEWDPEGPRKPLLTSQQVRQVADAGIEIGSHGLRHVSLPKAPESALAEEIDAAVVEGVRAAGYGYGCAIWPSEYTGQHALPRTFIGESDSSPRLWAKGLRHWLTWDYR